MVKFMQENYHSGASLFCYLSLGDKLMNLHFPTPMETDSTICWNYYCP